MHDANYSGFISVWSEIISCTTAEISPKPMTPKPLPEASPLLVNPLSSEFHLIHITASVSTKHDLLVLIFKNDI